MVIDESVYREDFLDYSFNGRPRVFNVPNPVDRQLGFSGSVVYKSTSRETKEDRMVSGDGLDGVLGLEM